MRLSTPSSARGVRRPSTRISNNHVEVPEVSEVMICPASGSGAYANVVRTVAHGIAWSTIAPVVSSESAEALVPLINESRELKFWGFRENSRDRRNTHPVPPQSWRRLVPGTRLVFIGRGRPTFTGVIGAILFDPLLSETLWASPEFGWVVALTDVRELPDVSDDEVKSAAGFSRVQMSMPVPAHRRLAIHELLGLARRLPTATPVNSLEQLDPLAPLSVWAVAERRNEQSLLRRSLVADAVVSCDLCGDDLPATFVRAAHVKPRALCPTMNGETSPMFLSPVSSATSPSSVDGFRLTRDRRSSSRLRCQSRRRYGND